MGRVAATFITVLADYRCAPDYTHGCLALNERYGAQVDESVIALTPTPYAKRFAVLRWRSTIITRDSRVWLKKGLPADADDPINKKPLTDCRNVEMPADFLNRVRWWNSRV